MKKLFTLTFLFSCFISFANREKTYKYYMYLTSSTLIPQFENVNGNYQYVGNNNNFAQFISNYKVLLFEQAAPASEWEHISKVAIIHTTDGKLAEDLLKNFPDVYVTYEDISNFKNELLFYPNDYGTSSPNPYSGAPIERRELDYINVAKAWDVTDGNHVKIGISDARINMTDLDFQNLSLINPSYYQFDPFVPGNLELIHGTATAGAAGAIGNNNHGTTGVCANCDLIGTQYGNFNNLILLAQSGARVINMSWVTIYTNQL
jgi:Subtilase family